MNSAIPVNPERYMGAHPNVYFMSPSSNIGCYIFDEYENYAECTIGSYLRPTRAGLCARCGGLDLFGRIAQHTDLCPCASVTHVQHARIRPVSDERKHGVREFVSVQAFPVWIWLPTQGSR